MSTPLRATERFGLVRPGVDAHTLGISSVGQLLEDCGYEVVIADSAICAAAAEPQQLNNWAILERWFREQRITRLGFSYRLDPEDGVFAFGRMLYLLEELKLWEEDGGQIAGVYFAGLPSTCEKVRRTFGKRIPVFFGDETPTETLTKLGVPVERQPREIREEAAYDEARLAFGRDLIARERHLQIKPVDRTGYPEFGTAKDTMMARVAHGTQQGLPPLMRAHVGPYQPNREEAVGEFLSWCERLGSTGFLDVLSIGTSQLSQERFGEEWAGAPDGGGVPLNTELELRAVWDAARPMLVRTYAGTKHIPERAQIHEETLHIAWHALSFWWFSQMDGRGPHSVKNNLHEHIETLKVIARTGKPFEPNIPHHFAFRGADDVTCVVSAVLAARTALRYGIKYFVLQAMLNTPKYLWGVQDLAKMRAMLILIRELAGPNFQIYLQPRAGLDYFSHDLEKAKAQLAAASALMDDIEPHDTTSPQIIHVVSYSEGSHLADPPVIDESIQITRAALEGYRALRQRGEIDDMAKNTEVVARTQELVRESRILLAAIRASIANPYSPEGLYEVLACGFLTAPYLWECRDEFCQATQWQTKVTRGSVRVVDTTGRIVPTAERAGAASHLAFARARQSGTPPAGWASSPAGGTT